MCRCDYLMYATVCVSDDDVVEFQGSVDVAQSALNLLSQLDSPAAPQLRSQESSNSVDRALRAAKYKTVGDSRDASASDAEEQAETKSSEAPGTVCACGLFLLRWYDVWSHEVAMQV